MRTTTAARLQDWWQRLFGVTGPQLWEQVTVQHPHGLLADYPGWYVAWLGAGVHVSAPSQASADDVASLRTNAAIELRESAFWAAYAHQRGLTLLGPSIHHVLDADPGPDAGIVDLDGPEDLAELRTRVTPAEWDESGVAHAETFFGLLEDGRLVAASALDEWDGAPRDVSVLVDPDARGRGLATRVGGHATSYAVRHHQVARWRALTTNLPSTRAARRLGFEPYCSQLAMRPRGVSGS